MSIVPKATIDIISQSIGLNNLNEDVATALAADVEYRMREIMQEAVKSMRHSKRSILTTEDVSCALSLRNVEPLYRFASSDPLRFKREANHPDIYYIDDRELDVKEVVDAPLPKAPLDTSVLVHWLAVEGVQPAIPENAPVEGFATAADTKKVEMQAVVKKEEDVAVEVKASVKHVLSRELQLYFGKITEIVVSGADSGLLKAALASLATDSGLHPLVPYFTQFIADEVTRSLDEFTLLFSLMRVVKSLLLNPHIHLEPYLHQLMPSVITCLVARRLGGNSMEDQWHLRDFTASIVAFICRRFGHAYHNLQSRVTKTLLHAFLDPKRAITQHYGAIQGLAALGSRVVRLLVLPNLRAYLQLLAPEMCLESQPNEMKRYEAWRVYGALLYTAGECLYEKLKAHPDLLWSTSSIILSSSVKVITALNKPDLLLNSGSSAAMSRKRPASTDPSSQSSQKKIYNQAAVADPQTLPCGDAPQGDTEMKGTEEATGSQADPVESNLKAQKEGHAEDKKKEKRHITRREETLLSEDDVGALLDSAVHLFGEGMLPFVPMRELSLFL